MDQDPDAALLEAAKPVYEQLDRMESQAGGLLKQVVIKVRDNLFTQKYTIARLLAAIGVSRSVVQSFRARFGMTPRAFIYEARMSTTARLLRDTTLPVEEIAFLVGYEMAALGRAFKRWCALAPTQFRTYAQKLGEPLRQLPDDVWSPEFWERSCEGQLNRDELLAMIRHYETAYDFSPDDC